MKKNSGQIVIGYDISDNCAQISYYMAGAEDVETLAVVAGTEQYNIPLVLCKRKEVGQWFFGKEALKFADEQEGILVEGLLSLAREGEPVDVGGTEFDPVALLTLFVKRSLSLLGLVASPDHLAGVMFTTDNLDKRMVEVFTMVAANLNLKTDKIFFQSHVESFYHYTLHQPEELWTHEVLLCDYDGVKLKTYGLAANRRTTPKVILIDTDEWGEMAKQDSAFLEILKERCNGRAVSCVYLIGEGFRDDWASESLRYLCRGRRVFQGNNLYSRGACCGIREKLGWEEEKEDGRYVFLGLDKLKANIGMRLLRRGIESYYAVMDGGVNWFEASREFDVILESGDMISVLLTPLNGKAVREINIKLEGLTERPDWTTRLGIEVKMLSEEQVSIRVQDKGFGEFFPSTGAEWVKTFEI